MGLVLHKGCDDPAQGEEALVDASCLSSCLVVGARPPDAFASCQIHLEKGMKSIDDSLKTQVVNRCLLDSTRSFDEFD